MYIFAVWPRKNCPPYCATYADEATTTTHKKVITEEALIPVLTFCVELWRDHSSPPPPHCKTYFQSGQLLANKQLVISMTVREEFLGPSFSGPYLGNFCLWQCSLNPLGLIAIHRCVSALKCGRYFITNIYNFFCLKRSFPSLLRDFTVFTVTLPVLKSLPL